MFVLIQVSFCSKPFLTDFAEMWFITSMQPHVGNQLLLLRKAFFAKAAHKGLSDRLRHFVTEAHFGEKVFVAKIRFLTSVPSCMLYQSISLLEAFLTDTTDKRIFTGMHPLVRDERFFLSKALLTKSAHIGPLACVYPAVQGKIALFFEDFLAHAAGVKSFQAIQVFTNGGSSLCVAALLTAPARMELSFTRDPLVVVGFPCVANV